MAAWAEGNQEVVLRSGWSLDPSWSESRRDLLANWIWIIREVRDDSRDFCLLQEEEDCRSRL